VHSKQEKLEYYEVIAVGDAENDRIMLMTAGFSVAMGNALEELKVLADAVTADNDHNGVGEAIRKYLV
jgi:hydroxymethylpyrimidine pyrophosphatase-like HAD family hydrolase